MTHHEIIEALQDYKLPSPLVHEISASIFRLYDDIERAQDRTDRLRTENERLASALAENEQRRAVLEAQYELMLIARDGALAALTQPATFPADVEAARVWLRQVIE